MTREFSYSPDKCLSFLSVRIYDKETFVACICVRFREFSDRAEINSVDYHASRPAALVGFSVRLEIDCALRVAENLARKFVTIEQLNNANVLGELFD